MPRVHGGPAAGDSILRFGPFEIDVVERSLWRRGEGLEIQEKPLRLLETLVAQAGSVVPREELYSSLWPDVEHLDFEANLNAAVRKLRKSLGRDARWVETLPRRGYRWKGPALEEGDAPSLRPAGRGVLVVSSAAAVGVIALVALLLGGRLPPAQATPLRLALMPFELAVDGPAQKARMARLSETLLTELAGPWEPALDVVGPRSTARFAGRPFPDLERLQAELAVDYVVNGRLVEDDAGTSLIVELIRLSDRGHPWVDRFEGSPDVDEVAAQTRRGIARALALTRREADGL